MRKQLEANLLAIVESTEDLIWSVGLDNRLTFFNGAYRRAFEIPYGVTPAVGMLSEDLVPPERAAIFPPLYKRALTEGPFRTEYITRAGQILEMALSPIFVDGKAIGVSVFGKDVTAWKCAVNEAQEAEKKLRDVFDGALEGLFRISLDGHGLIVNKAMANMLGYDSPNDLVTTAERIPNVVWVDPQDRAKCVELFHRRGYVRGFECRFKRKNGAQIWVAINLQAFSGADGKTSIIDGFVEDITKRKQALDVLRERETQLKEAERIAHIGSSRWYADTDTSIWSEGLCRITGWDPNAPGPTREEREKLYTPESWARFNEAFHYTLATGKTRELDLQLIRTDGEMRWVHARGSSVRDASGRITQVIGTLQDITEQKLAEAKLRESEERYRATFEQAAIGIVHASFDGPILRCNARFAEIVGYTIEELQGLTYAQITAPDEVASSANVIQRLLRGETPHSSWEKRYIRKDGTPVWVRITTSIQRDDAGRPLHLETFVEDIDARKAAEQKLAQAQEELKASEARYRTIFQTSLDGIIISRLDNGLYIDANQAFLNMLGYEREEVIGHTSQELGMWTDIKIREGIAQLLRRDSSFRSLTIPYRRKDGSIFWMQLSASVIEMDGVKCIVCVTRDTSEIRAAEEKIKDLALYDQLTRLPNRQQLLERLEVSLAARTRHSGERALLFLDLDNFKKLNDTIGHHVGDLLLQEVARRLTSCVRGADTVARCGGDEFCILLEGLGRIPEPAATQAHFVAAKIASAIGQPYSLAGHEYHCHCSIGATVFGNAATENALQILQQAELALHRAKIDGRSAIRFFAPDLQLAVTARATIEDDMRLSIRDNQFLLYYQPLVDSHGLTGAEALVRWNHPERGILAPSEFIPMAEETGLILPLGECILEAACTQIAQWAKHPEAGHLVLSVNISAQQFRQPEFVEQVLSVLSVSGANPQNLRLELTESMLLEDIESIIGKMTLLKEQGVRFSIDDFGTGYSSLSYLKRLPIDQLKIDRSFVEDILVDETGAAIAQAIISLSRALGLSVIAEGVETEEQREFLSDLGCDAFQGYLFGYPLPLDQFEKLWLAHGKSPSRLFLTKRPS